MKNNRGFTLIELMIVVAIIGILASISLPAYQDYTTRAKIAESIVLVSELKPNVVSYYRAKSRFPADNTQAGIPASQYIIGNHVRGVSVKNGAIHIELGNKVPPDIEGKILTLRPIVVIGSPESPISWLCGNGEVPTGMQAIGDNLTSLEGKHLPAACRH
jgi:type IV pilus assembly protein PilA